MSETLAPTPGLSPQEEDGAVLDYQHALISSARVEGTPVYSPREERLGTIHSVMIHKQTGQVAYALLSFGGFLGMGAHVHPVPWTKLRFDVDLAGYVIETTREQLRKAPSFALDYADRPIDPNDEERVYDYYQAPKYWGL